MNKLEDAIDSIELKTPLKYSSPRERLLAAHEFRLIDRSKIGRWLRQLDQQGNERFDEYVAAYHDLHEQRVGTVSLIQAIATDDLLGPGWPEMSSDAFKKWLDRNRPPESR